MNTTASGSKKRKERRIVTEWTTDSSISVQTLASTALPEYVAWIDLMGAQGWMAGSIRRAAEMIGLIHIAGLAAARKYQLKVYPVIDGIYLVGAEKKKFTAAARQVMRQLAATFQAQKKPDRRFLVRGGIAYGRVLHGSDIVELHDDLKKESGYSQCIALGISIGQAYGAEKKAPPFGFYVDSTARSTASVDALPYSSAFFRWWSMADESEAAEKFGELIDLHFEYLNGRHLELEYSLEDLNRHRDLAREYFKLKVEKVTLRSEGVKSPEN